MQKGTMLYKAMEKYRRKFLVCNLIALAVLILFTVWKFPFIKTEIKGASALDTKRYISETGTFDIDELIELTRHESKSPENFYHRDITYWQDNTYLFDIKADSIEKTDIVFTEAYKFGNQTQEYVAAEIWFATIEGRRHIVIGKPGADYKTKLTGYLAKPNRALLAPISENVENGSKITLSDYVIDCRDVDMETASSDWWLVKIVLAVLILLFAKLLIYYLRPELTPTYRQLRRYGNIEDISDEVNRQALLPEAYVEDNTLVTPDFILSDDTFKKKVVRNHMNKH